MNEIFEKIIDISIKNLSQKELISINRKIRIYRLCMVSALISIMTFDISVFEKNILSIRYWESYQYFFFFLVLFPLFTIFILTSYFMSIGTTAKINNEIDTKTVPAWVDLIMLFLIVTLIASFASDVSFPMALSG